VLGCVLRAVGEGEGGAVRVRCSNASERE
jgi:hypothetical protein